MADLYSYEEDCMGNIRLLAPDGEDLYMQTDTDIQYFTEELQTIEHHWYANGERVLPHPLGFVMEEEEISEMISNYFLK